MNSVRKQLRSLLQKKEIIVAPGGFDALTCKVVEHLGFKVAYMGGWVTGAHLCITEPLMTLTEQVMNASFATRVLKIPLIVDADAGFGDAVHTYRTVQEFERAGVAGIHIEDQVFPKRAHYHKGVEHVVPLEEFIAKLKSAMAARTDKDFLIIARTDGRNCVGGSLEEVIRRAKACADIGVDMIKPMLYGRSLEEMKAFRKAVPNIPLAELSGGSGRNYSAQELAEVGYQMMLCPITPIVSAIDGVLKTYTELKETGKTNFPEARGKQVRSTIEELIGLPGYYKIEEATTEAS